MAQIDFRDRAFRHWSAAQEILSRGKDDEVRYACLELRQTIEAIAFDMMQLYRDDLPDAVLQQWNAYEVLKEIAILDPGADGTITLRIDGAPGEPPLELVDYRISARWARKTYRQLGHFLHERTLKELERGAELTPGQMRERVVRIADELGRVVNSTGYHLKFCFNVRLPCQCGAQMSFQMAPYQTRKIAKCLGCEIVYDMRPKVPGDLQGTFVGRRLDAVA